MVRPQGYSTNLPREANLNLPVTTISSSATIIPAAWSRVSPRSTTRRSARPTRTASPIASTAATARSPSARAPAARRPSCSVSCAPAPATRWTRTPTTVACPASGSSCSSSSCPSRPPASSATSSTAASRAASAASASASRRAVRAARAAGSRRTGPGSSTRSWPCRRSWPS